MDQKDIDLYVLARNVIFRYQLDQYEDEQLSALLLAFDRARRTLGKRLDALGPGMEGSFTQERALALLDEVNAMTAGLRQKTAGDIGTVSTSAGVQAFAVHQDIVSIGGLLTVNTLSVTPEQIQALVVDTPIGGRTLAGWVEKTFDRQMAERIREEVLEGTILGEGYPSMVKRLEDAVDLTKRDAITLARTYVHNVNTSAQEAVYRANSGVVKGMKWCATLENGRLSTGHGTCLRCAALDGTIYKLDEEHPPIPLHPRCLTPETPVLAPDKVAATISSYDGPVFEFVLSNGARFSVTANHMLLTDKGFSPAHSVRQGAKILYDSVAQRILFSDPHNNNGVSSIQDVVRSLSESPGMVSRRVPVSPEHLHGDGEFIKGHVDVIAPASLLRGDTKSFVNEHRDKWGLFRSDVPFASLTPEGDLLKPLLWLALATGGGIRGQSVSDVLLSRSLGHHEPVRVSRPTYFYPGLHKDPSHNVATHFKSLGDGVLRLSEGIRPNDFIGGKDYPSRKACLGLSSVWNNPVFLEYQRNGADANAKVLGDFSARFPGRISVTDVLMVRERHFSGHVYDLQTLSSLYSIPGAITSNCRCVMLPELMSWRDMGIPIDELEDATRPYTIRELKNIDEGGKRTILEVGHHDGDYTSWFDTLPERRKLEVLGPGRLALYREGQVDFHEFVDGSGRLRTIKELKGGAKPRGGSGQGGPVPAPGG